MLSKHKRKFVSLHNAPNMLHYATCFFINRKKHDISKKIPVGMKIAIIICGKVAEGGRNGQTSSYCR